MRSIHRAGGVGLLAYGIGVTGAFLTLGAPGGDYTASAVESYIASGHWPTAFALGYVGALASLGLLVFGQSLRSLGGAVGELVWGLSIAGTTTGVVGAFVAVGIDVAMAEGGHVVQEGVSFTVIYTISEIGNLLSVCGPAFFAGAIALVLAARASLPGWVRAFSGVAGVCGILAPFYVTLFVFALWTVVFGSVLAAARPSRSAALRPRESLV
jgi:hypothetical protein